MILSDSEFAEFCDLDRGVAELLLRRAAIHGAGHAGAALVLKIRVRRASIVAL